MTKRKVMGTYHSFAQAEALEDRGGRFAVLDKPAVTGSSPIPSYPAIPDGPWSKVELPDEALIDGRGEGDVTGYAIDDMGLGTPTPTSESSPVADDAGVGRAPKFLRRI
jgi:hypothetical protein